jgi:uncharacterized protein YjbI with pentapeptide repeats
LERAGLVAAHLERAVLTEAHLEGATLIEAHLEGALLIQVHLEGKRMAAADLARIRRWVEIFPERLPPADLRLAFLNEATRFVDGSTLGTPELGYVRVADVRWGGVNLAIVDWKPFTEGEAVLGEEQTARSWQGEQFSETSPETKTQT